MLSLIAATARRDLRYRMRRISLATPDKPDRLYQSPVECRPILNDGGGGLNGMMWSIG